MNFFKVKKWMAFLLAGVMPMCGALFILFSTNNVWFSIIGGFIFSLVMVFISTYIIYKHPIMGVMEGEGILGLTLDSTGIMTPFLLRVATPYVHGNLQGEELRTTFDREAVNYLMNPKQGTISYGDDGKLHLTLDEKEYKNDIMNLGGIPTIIYNKHMGAFMSKEMLSSMETTAFVQHLVLHLNRRTDELSSNVRDFARYIVEQTRPKKGFWENPAVIGGILIVAVIIMAIFFGPKLLEQLGVLGPAAASAAPSSAVVIPASQAPAAVIPTGG